MPQRRAKAFLVMMVAAIFLLTAALILLMTRPAWPAGAGDPDPFACFGWARYVAMAESFRCTDLPAFCASARSLVQESGGDRHAAEHLARARGHSRLSIMLAKRFCR